MKDKKKHHGIVDNYAIMLSSEQQLCKFDAIAFVV